MLLQATVTLNGVYEQDGAMRPATHLWIKTLNVLARCDGQQASEGCTLIVIKLDKSSIGVVIIEHGRGERGSATELIDDVGVAEFAHAFPNWRAPSALDVGEVEIPGSTYRSQDFVLVAMKVNISTVSVDKYASG